MVHIRRISLGYPGNWEYQRISADEMISGGHRRMGLYPDIGFYSKEKIAANATLKILSSDISGAKIQDSIFVPTRDYPVGHPDSGS